MPSKPNYNHQRAERDRAKKAKKEERLQGKREQSDLRKASQEGSTQTEDGPVQPSGK